MNFNQELNNIFNLGLLIVVASLWIFHVLYFWVPLFVPSARNQLKLKDIDLNTISSFTMQVGVGLTIGLGIISSLYPEFSDIYGYLYALVSTLVFCLIWRYVREHWG